MPKKKNIFFEIYSLLFKVYGPRNWWPADNAFEVIVGAILTQNTSWTNVEKAISNLKKEGLLSPRVLHDISLKRLARLIHPCGYYNIKAKRLKSFIAHLFSSYGGILTKMGKRPLRRLREELLSIKGIGPETADSILLYAFKRPIFVVDAYTRRITICHGITAADSTYDEIQSIFMENLPANTKVFNEYHALLVEHAKRVCRKLSLCKTCVLRSLKKAKSPGGRPCG